MLVNIDGKFVPPDHALVPIFDGGFLYGDTLFETLKAKNRHIHFMAEHLDRLELSARLLGFPCPRQTLAAALGDMAARLDQGVFRLRLTLSRGDFEGPRLPPSDRARFVLTATPADEPTDAQREQGAACVFAPNQRVNPLSHLPQMKRGNYADCLYAADFARGRGAREALFVTADEVVLEGATTNIFLVRDSLLLTPPAGELVLAGIMRRKVLDAAARIGIETIERNIVRQELFTAEEVFLTNSLIDLLPVASVEGTPLRRGTLWRTILAANYP